VLNSNKHFIKIEKPSILKIRKSLENLYDPIEKKFLLFQQTQKAFVPGKRISPL